MGALSPTTILHAGYTPRAAWSNNFAKHAAPYQGPEEARIERILGKQGHGAHVKGALHALALMQLIGFICPWIRATCHLWQRTRDGSFCSRGRCGRGSLVYPTKAVYLKRSRTPSALGAREHHRHISMMSTSATT